MLIPEAVSLILQSCLHAKGGEIFILDMGKPVKIYDLVKDLILLLERQPGKDVPIDFIGLRPGEKMHEELFIEGFERLRKLDGFFVNTSPAPDFDEMRRLLEGILNAGQEERVDHMLASLHCVVSSGIKMVS